MSELVEIEDSTSPSVLNAFEVQIQDHENELNFIPDMKNEESRSLSDDAYKASRKTHKKIDSLRLAGKKELEKAANEFHELGKAGTNRLEAAGAPHKAALDKYKADQKAIEEAVKQSFYDACQWLSDVANECQFASIDKINELIAEIESKDMDSTGIEMSKAQKLEYGKKHLNIMPGIQASLTNRIIAVAAEEEAAAAAIQLANQQEDIRQNQERLDAQQKKIKDEADRNAAEKQLEESNAAAAKAATEKAELDKAKAIKEKEKEISDAAEALALEKKKAEDLAAQKVLDDAKAVSDAAAAAAQKIVDDAAEKEAENKRLQEAAATATYIEAKRVADLAEEARLATETREKDKAHKGRIMKESKLVLMANGIDEAVARKVLTLIAKREIPHVSVKF